MMLFALRVFYSSRTIVSSSIVSRLFLIILQQEALELFRGTLRQPLLPSLQWHLVPQQPHPPRDLSKILLMQIDG